MKKIIYFFAVIGLLSACVCKPISKPKNLKAIDFENWNDVETVHYNCKTLCSEPSDMEGRIVKISGWCYCDNDHRLCLIDINNPNKPKKNCYNPDSPII
ncbi:MAG: hypothetical protein LBS16_06115, partial [Prevotellaceae bacterium]|nr:hypothetical protein [Prevotellaceae bacterium]